MSNIKIKIKRFAKECISIGCNIFGIFAIDMKKLNNKLDNNYIRIINYHNYSNSSGNFEKQLKWYSKNFQNITKQDFTNFLDGKKIFKNKPGIMITFDDGLIGNYNYSLDLLDKYGFTGYFFLSPGLIGSDGYMSQENVNELISRGHQIGCHTYTHKRIYGDETDEVLNYEIIQSKHKLEEMFGVEVDMFCWCGGERGRYSKDAYRHIVQAGYKYAFNTNAKPVLKDVNKHILTRSNIEETFSISTTKFQVSSFNDLYYNKKYEEELKFFK